MSVLIAPLQNLFIGAALQDARNKPLVIDPQKSAGASVKTETAIVVCRKLALGVESNLIQHPAKENDSSNLIVGTAKVGNLHR